MLNVALHGVALVCAASATLGCAYLIVAVLAVRAPPARRGPSAGAAPVTYLKPLRGAEPGLARRLRAFLDQDYPGARQMICGVADGSDPAAEVVRAFGDEIELCVNPAQHGVNRKVSNLVNMARLARHDLIVMADSDIEAPRDYLAQVVAALQAPGVGAVSCLYHGIAGGGFWARMAALRINAQFLPDAATALRFGLTSPCFGSTIALTRDTLRRIGGLKSFADRLADDFAIGEAVRSAGLRVAIPPFTVAHVCFARGFADLFAQERRAARTVRSVAPWGHAGAVITHPFALALIAAPDLGAPALGLAAAALGLRALLCWRVGRAFGAPPQPLWLLPLRDLLSFLVFATSFFGAGVTWRGVSYRVVRSGDLAAPR